MRLLPDTHVLLWWFTDDARLSAAAQQAISEVSSDVFVSAASAWEIATKQRIGKLDGIAGAVTRFSELVAADGFIHLPMTHLHGLRTGGYDVPHRDPFDSCLRHKVISKRSRW